MLKFGGPVLGRSRYFGTAVPQILLKIILST